MTVLADGSFAVCVLAGLLCPPVAYAACCMSIGRQVVRLHSTVVVLIYLVALVLVGLFLSGAGMSLVSEQAVDWLMGVTWTPILFAAIAGFPVGVIIVLTGSRLGTTSDPRLCGRCKYSLIGNTSGICSECGMPIPDEQRRFLSGLS
jgi:hypothetical protein